MIKKALTLCVAATTAVAAQAETLSSEFHLDTRLRYEVVDQDNALENAEALTMRFRPRIESSYGPVKFLAEGEVTAEVGDNFNSSRNGETGYSVVADPANFQINRLQLGLKEDTYEIALGRQLVNIGNQRFVGSVGWRQNDQTMDAVSVKLTPIDKLSLGYTYIDQVNTIFGVEGDAPRAALSGEQKGAIHLANLDSKLSDMFSVEAYGYFMDFDDVAAWSNQTVGAALTTSVKNAELRVEYANQSEYGSQPLDYSADYLNVSLTGKNLVPKTSLTVGYEMLGSDQGVIGFQTPLATKHAFNGWADIFLGTPANGLTDLYLNAAMPMPYGAKLVAQGHKYDSDEGSMDYGYEASAVYVQPIKAVKGLKGLVKYTHYEAEDGNYVDTDKVWVQLDLSL